MGGQRARRAVLKRVGRFNRVMGGDHKLERADPMVQCEVQAHNSTALEINQHLAGVIFHIIHYACRHNRNPRFPADVAPAKSTSRAAGRRAESPSHRGQICTARVPSTAGPRAHCAVHVKNLKICRGSELTRF